MNRSLGKIQLKLLKALHKKPMFVEELTKKIYGNVSISKNMPIFYSLRRLRHRGFNIKWFSYGGQRNQGKRLNIKIPHFKIIFFKKDRIKAWEKVERKYPQIKGCTHRWVTFGRPILGDLMVPGGNVKCCKGKHFEAIQKKRARFQKKYKKRKKLQERRTNK